MSIESNTGEGRCIHSSSLIVVAGNLGQKGKHPHLHLQCVISCDNRIATRFLLES